MVAYIFLIGVMQYFPFLNQFTIRTIEIIYLLLAIMLVRRLKMPISQFGF